MALSACTGEEPWPPPLFDCASSGERYLLRAMDDGDLVLEIEGAAEGNVGVSTWLHTWSDIRTGYVIGQQGGHQSHLRLFDGKQHFVLYEGENGQLSGDPGATYAGVALIGDGLNAEPQEIVACEASPTNRTILENVRKVRARAKASELSNEEAGGPFDMWF